MKKLSRIGTRINTGIKSKISLRSRFAVAMLFMFIIPGLLFTFIYFKNIKEFYRSKIEVYQVNKLNMRKARVEEIIRQGATATDQTLGLAVNSSLFGSYYDMNPYQRLHLYWNVNSLLSNMRISNAAIDNIYMIGAAGSNYTSNTAWDRAKFLKSKWIVPSRKFKKGGFLAIPTHRAAYEFLNTGSDAPFVISFVTYLNRNSDNKVINLVQIDISYRMIKEAMSELDDSDQEQAFILDADNNIIYASRDEMLGKGIKNTTINGISLNTFLHKAGSNAVLSMGNYTIRKSTINGSRWSILQISSDRMFVQEMQKVKNAWELVAAICLLVAGFMAFLISFGITKPVTNIIKSMKNVSSGDFTTKIEDVYDKELEELVNSFNSMVSEIDTLLRENLQKERERLTMELLALNSQINSHFLYNTLNAIKWMAIRRGAEDITRTIVSLVNMLEYSCKNVDVPVPISDEIQFIKHYLTIYEARYEKHIEVEYSIDKALEDCMILKILLQPIVENSLLHGFQDEAGDNRIIILVEEASGYVRISIRDNGKGFSYEGMDRLTGIGLHNIQDRINLNYGNGYGLVIRSGIGEGTCVTVSIPVIRKGEALYEEAADR